MPTLAARHSALPGEEWGGGAHSMPPLAAHQPAPSPKCTPTAQQWLAKRVLLLTQPACPPGSGSLQRQKGHE